MVNVFPPPTVAMEEVVDVVMAVMREDAVSWLRVNSTWALNKAVFHLVAYLQGIAESLQ